MASTIIKRPPEDRAFTIDFSNYKEIASGGQTIASIVAVTLDPPLGLTLGTVSITAGAKSLTVNLADGVHNTAFRIEATILTDLGKKLTNEVAILVTHDPIGSVS